MLGKEEALEKIAKEVLNLTTSPLYEYRVENNYLPVFGEGSANAEIIFVGEAPGKNEAITGKPFCGRAGKMLDTLLESAGISREEVYITSIVKDRPPKNRDPKPDEIALYAPFLDKQIEIIKPKVVATLGRFSMEYIMRRYGLEGEIKTIGELHGKVFQAPNFKLVPLYHPAATVYNQRLLGTLKEDFKVLTTLD
ncbi:MAG: uracil-DNA glycosylase [Candidatus Zambryskibacteria bacterium]|nr:uracil-DNA glycosylase [Candidatus Zambryskibacteria bacterium]